MIISSLVSILALSAFSENQAAEAKPVSETVLFAEKYCFPTGTVGERALLLEIDGWKDELVPIESVPETDLGFRVFTHPDHAQIIIISSPTGNTNIVRDCLVDGKGIGVKPTVNSAIAKWGVPKRFETPDDSSKLIYYWPQPKKIERSLFIRKSMIIQNNNDEGLAIAVRFGPSKFPTKEEQNVHPH